MYRLPEAASGSPSGVNARRRKRTKAEKKEAAMRSIRVQRRMNEAPPPRLGGEWLTCRMAPAGIRSGALKEKDAFFL